jgi:hypothetical protein
MPPEICDITSRMLASPRDRQGLHDAVRDFSDTECTYFLCPDPDCELFFRPDCHVPCDNECPHKAEKAIVCRACGATIILPFEHFSWCRVECACGGCNFQRMSGIYQRFHLPDEAKT